MIYVCRYCEIKFNAGPSHKRKFCSKKCWKKFSLTANRITTKCFRCKKEFIHYQSVPRIYCSIKCASILRNYKEGKKIDRLGYTLLLQPHHPFAQKSGYIFEHRLIMEKYLGRFLTEKEIVHHKNNNRSDNRIKNLQLISNQSNHMKEHGFNRDVKYWGKNKNKLSY